MKKRNSAASVIRTVTAVGTVAAVLFIIFLLDSPWPTAARDYLESYGREETGAPNLVSGIYLGYRAYDTMGETIVLLVAVSGTIGILKKIKELMAAEERKEAGDASAFRLPAEKRKTHTLRTNLIEVVTGKIGPIVLIFGVYVMVYGHLSPGGGFQGGVIIASGIIFLALGSGLDTSAAFADATVLNRLEAGALLILVLASLSGIPAGKGFFGNPVEIFTMIPAAFIIFLNAVIGLKVGAGIGLLCISMLGEEL